MVKTLPMPPGSFRYVPKGHVFSDHWADDILREYRDVNGASLL